MPAAAQSNLLVKISGDISGLKGAMKQATGEVKGFGRAVGTSMKQVGGGMMNAGKKVTLLSAPLAAVGVLAVKTAGDFEAKMNIMATSASDTAVSMDDLRKATIGVGADTELVGISASEAADAITELYKAGKTTNEIFGDFQGYLEGSASLGGVLRASIDLAAASELDLARSTTLVNETLAQFKLGAEDATRVADLFVQTAMSSNTSLSDLEGTFQGVGNTLAGFGFELEEIMPLLAMLGDVGIKGAEGGTAIKSMFNHIMSGTKEVNQALSELKVNIYDTTTGAMKPMGVIVDDLSRALGENAEMIYQQGGATKEQSKLLSSYGLKIKNAKLAIEEYTAGVRGATMSEEKRAEKIAELNKKIDFYKGKQKELVDIIPGVTAETVKLTEAKRNEYVKTLAGAYGQKVLNAIVMQSVGTYDKYAKKIAEAATAQEMALARTQGYEAAIEQLGGSWEAFLIVIGTPIIETITPWINKLTVFIGKLAEASPATLSLITKLAMIAIVAGPILIALGALISAIGTVIGAISAIAGVVAAVVGGLTALAVPILAVVAVLGALYLAWQNNFLGIRDLLGPFVDEIIHIFDIVKGVFKDLGRVIKGEISWDDFVTRAKIAWERIKISAIRAWESLKEGLMQVWENIKNAFVNWLAEFLAPIFGSAEEAKAALITAWENIKTALSSAWETLKNVASTVWEGIKFVIEDTVEFIRGLLGGLVQFLSGDFTGAWETLKGTLGGIWDSIATKAGEAFEAVKEKVSTALETAKTKLSEAWDNMKETASKKWEGIRAAVKKKVDAVIEVINTIWDTISGIGGKIVGGILGAIGGLGGNVEVPEVSGGPIEWAKALRTTFEEMKLAVSENLTGMKEAYTTTTQEIATLHSEWLTLLQETLATFHITIQEMTSIHLAAIKMLHLVTWESLKIYLITTWTLLLQTFINHMTQMAATNLLYWTQIKANTIDLMTRMKDEVIGIFNAMRSAIKTILKKVAEDAYSAGKKIGQKLADGLRSKIGAVRAAARALADAARANLPSSDAKEGPLSDLTASGRALGEVFAKGMMQSQQEVGRAARMLANAATQNGQLTPAMVTSPDNFARYIPGQTADIQGGRDSRSYGGHTVIINNPVGETSERSLNKAMRRITYLGEPSIYQPQK